MARKLKAKHESLFPRLKCNKVGAADAVSGLTAKNSRNNVFNSKQTAKKVPPNIFTGFQVKKKVRLMF